MIYLSMAFLKWSKVPWIRDESDIAVKVTWKWHENAMNPRWTCDESDIQVRWSFLRWLQLLIWMCFRKKSKIRMKTVPWKCHEAYMNLTYCQRWDWNQEKKTNRQLKPTFWIILFQWIWQTVPRSGLDVKVPWNCHETTMKMPWLCHDFDFGAERKYHESAMMSPWIWHVGFM